LSLLLSTKEFCAGLAVANSGALSHYRGGDTDSAIHKAGPSAKMSYISTGGGAFFGIAEGKTLPEFAALEKSRYEPKANFGV